MGMKQQQSGRLWGLDLLKFLCALIIMDWHIQRTAALEFLFTEKIVYAFLICSGYVWCLSLDQKRVGLGEYYGKTVWKHLVRVLAPYTALFLVEVFYHRFWVIWTEESWIWLDHYSQGEIQGYFPVREMLARFWQGGLGPGGYYVGFLLQLAVLFGVIHWIAQKNPRLFLFVTLGLICVAFVWKLPLWGGYEWLVQTLLNIRPLGQMHFLIVLLGIGMCQNRDRLPRWGFLPVFLLAALVWSVSPDASDLLQAWGAFWCALELSRLRLPTKALAVIGRMGKASYFLYLMQKAYCASALARWFALKWNVYNEWNVLFCLVLGLAFYGTYTFLAGVIRRVWKNIRVRLEGGNGTAARMDFPIR